MCVCGVCVQVILLATLQNKHWLVEQAIVPLPEDSWQVIKNVSRNR
jgi:hypothetical protein